MVAWPVLDSVSRSECATCWFFPAKHLPSLVVRDGRHNISAMDVKDNVLLVMNMLLPIKLKVTLLLCVLIIWGYIVVTQTL